MQKTNRIKTVFLLLLTVLYDISAAGTIEWRPIREMNDQEKAIIAWHTKMRDPLHKVLNDATHFSLLAPKTLRLIRLDQSGHIVDRGAYGIHEEEPTLPQGGTEGGNHEDINPAATFRDLWAWDADAEEFSEQTWETLDMLAMQILSSSLLEDPHHSYAASMLAMAGNRYLAQFEEVKERLHPRAVLSFYDWYIGRTKRYARREDQPTPKERERATQEFDAALLAFDASYTMLFETETALKRLNPDVYQTLMRKGRIEVLTNF